MRIRGTVLRSLFILLIAVASPAVLFAGATDAVRLLVGRSAVIDIGTPIARVSLTSADIADAMVTANNQLLVNGKMPGTITMFVWERSGTLRQYEIVVQRDLAVLNEQMKRLFPGETIDAQSNGRAIVLSGLVSSKELSDKAMSVAGGYVEKPEDVVNLLRQQEGPGSNQVLLRVRFAEVSRSAMTELGASLFTGPNGYKNVLARSTTEQNPAPVFDNSDPAHEKLVFSDFLNLFLFDAKHQLGTVIKALQTKGMFQSLAEPNLVAESGKEASFLAGGEIPIPIAQGSGQNVAISVQYKEFGVRLNFTPTVTGSRIHLKVRPEVSTLDFSNAVVLQGFRIPALSTRRTETELELMDGQTFAIAGLMNNTVNSTLQKIPGIGDIPILGKLFQSKAAQKNQTELVVMITPVILPRNSPGVTPNLPRTPEPYLAPLPVKKTFEAPPPSFPQPPAVAPRTGDDGSAAAAAATVNAIMRPPHPPVVVQGPTPQVPSPAQSPSQTPSTQQPLTATQMPGAAAARPLTRDEQKALDRSHQQEELGKATDAKARLKQADVDRRNAKAEQENQAKQAQVQAKHDAEAAKVAAIQAKRQAQVDAAETKRLAELDRIRQKALDEAAAKAKAAEDRYQAERSRKQK